MKLQGSGWYTKLSSDINMVRDTNDRTPVCMIYQYSTCCELLRCQTNRKVTCDPIHI